MYVLVPGHIVLASDVAALSKPNRFVVLAVNRPCGNSADGGEGERGMLLLDIAARPS
jgi:hypothetical protein